MKRFVLLPAVLLLFSVYVFANSSPKREVRGAWVATVANIDWPSSRTASTGEQLKELKDIFDKLDEAGINTVYFQVRTECDALYKSELEPWSYWLTGEQGKAPEPFYDPLEEAVKEAHKRGMELHAWFNPYRSVKTVGDYKTADNHVSVKHPDWILTFDKYKMLDPGKPEVRKFISDIIRDVVSRYAVDGIHFDDYFYPYSPKVSTEDAESYRKYSNGIKDIDDWRRSNINTMVADVYRTINEVNSNVKFGISPFGIVENKYAGTNGFSSYDILYCDPLTWIKDKTVDYITPQLYWERGHKAADYSKLLPWWAEVSNPAQLYIGQYSSKMKAADYKGLKDEIEQQVELNRKTDNVLGSIYFSAKSITKDFSGFSSSLKEGVHKYPALIPQMLWKDSTAPNAPTELKAERTDEGIHLTWKAPAKAADGDEAKYYVIYKFGPDESVNLEDPRYITAITKDSSTSYIDKRQVADKQGFLYVVTAADKMHNESAESCSTYAGR